jgi:hypothetical protein
MAQTGPQPARLLYANLTKNDGYPSIVTVIVPDPKRMEHHYFRIAAGAY